MVTDVDNCSRICFFTDGNLAKVSELFNFFMVVFVGGKKHSIVKSYMLKHGY